MPKRTAVEISCDSFDHPDLQSLNNNKFIFGLATQILGIWGHVAYHWKILENPFPILHAPKKIKITVAK